MFCLNAFVLKSDCGQDSVYRACMLSTISRAFVLAQQRRFWIFWYILMCNMNPVSSVAHKDDDDRASSSTLPGRRTGNWQDVMFATLCHKSTTFELMTAYKIRRIC